MDFFKPSKKSNGAQRWYKFAFDRRSRRWDELVAHMDELLSSIKLRDVSVQYIKYIVSDSHLYGVARFNRRIYVSYARDVFRGASIVYSMKTNEVFNFLRQTSEGPSFEMGSQNLYPYRLLSSSDSSNDSSFTKTTRGTKRKVPPADIEKVDNMDDVDSLDKVCTFL